MVTLIDGVPAGGEDVILNLHYNGMDVLSALVDLEAYNLTVSDADGDVVCDEYVSSSYSRTLNKDKEHKL